MGPLSLKKKIGQPHLGHSNGRSFSSIIVLHHQGQLGAGQKSLFIIIDIEKKDLKNFAPHSFVGFYAKKDESKPG